MAATRLVLLLVATYFCGLEAQFPQGGSAYGQQSLLRPPMLLTCLGGNEAGDQIRVTARQENDHLGYGQSPRFQYGQQSPELMRTTWRLSAVYIPASSLGLVSQPGTTSLVGRFYLVVTKYGRTEGRCAGLGGILMQEDLVQSGNSGYGNRGFNVPGFGRYPGMFGGNSPFGSRFGSGFGSRFGSSFGSSFGSRFGHGSSYGYPGFGGQSPFNSFGSQFGGPGSFGGQSFGSGSYGHSMPPGLIQDPMVLSNGGSVYTGVIKGVAAVDMRGRGLVLSLDQYGTRPTTTCCTFAVDKTAATDQVGQFPTGPITGNILQQNNLNGGIGNINGGVIGGINGLNGGIGGINGGIGGINGGINGGGNIINNGIDGDLGGDLF